MAHFTDKYQLLKILDLGSGSGCLGLSLLDEYQNSTVSFLDTSQKSLEIVKINSENFGLSDRSKLIHLDWRNENWDTELFKIEKENKFDILISNPPYIPTNDIKKLQKEVKEYDPFIALNGGKEGLDAYKLIIPKLRNLIKKNGKIFFEIGKGQENFVSSKAIETSPHEVLSAVHHPHGFHLQAVCHPRRLQAAGMCTTLHRNMQKH